MGHAFFIAAMLRSISLFINILRERDWNRKLGSGVYYCIAALQA